MRNDYRYGLLATLERDVLRSLDLTPLTPWTVMLQLLLSPELRLVVAFRLYSWLSDHVRWSLGYTIYMYTRGRTGCDLALGAAIGPGLRIEHRSDIVIGASAVLGCDISVYNGVTVGKRRPPRDEMPRIGDRVTLGSGAKILGDIRIGDDVVVGANAVVLNDVKSGTTVAGIPARPVGPASRGTG